MDAGLTYFTTEQDFITASDAALYTLERAKELGIISVEWDFSGNGGSVHDSKLAKLAADIVSAIARSNVPVSGDITSDPSLIQQIDYKVV